MRPVFLKRNKKLFISMVALFAAMSAFFILSGYVQVHAQTFPEPRGYVNDFEEILNNDEELEQKLKTFEDETSNEIAVVTVKDFQETTIEEFAVRLFEAWGIGQEDKDNGVLILVSATQRQSRIEVGYGLEGALPDALTGRIQDNEMIPHFRDDDYSAGVAAGVDAVIAATAGEYTPTEESVPEEVLGALVAAGPFVFFVLVGLFQAIAFSKSWWLGGLLGVIAGLLIGGWIPILFLGILGLLIDFILSKLFANPRVRKNIPIFGSGSWGSGKSWGSGGWSGGSSGGFGGGSSGGGGSSRSW